MASDLEPPSEGFSSKKLIGGLNFRHIMDSLDDANNVKEGNLYFMDEAVSDSEAAVLSFRARLSRGINQLSSKILLIEFLTEITRYFSARTKILLVLSGVVAEVFNKQFEGMKRFTISRMFWGRSNLFRFSLQVLGIFLVVMAFISFNYNKGISGVDYQVQAASANVSEVNHNQDLIVQNASTLTQPSTNAQVYEEPKEYVVKGGDTLSLIAEAEGVSVDTLMWSNDLSTGDVIQPGMRLKIPGADGVLIEVEKGDTVESLAEEYKTNGQLIVEANFLRPPDYVLTPGEEIFLPDGSIEAPPPPPTPAAPIYSGVISNAPVSTGVSGSSAGGAGRFLSWPVSGGTRLSQCFSGWHNGIDIASDPIGSKPALIAAAPGTVTFAGCQSGYCPPAGQDYGGSGLAWTVIISHGNGYSSVYGHMNSISVASGQSVSRGQSIGVMGRSGLAYGVHVHFMLVHSGTWSAVNPAPYMTSSVCGY